MKILTNIPSIDGNSVCVGDLIRINSWDNDDYHYWKFKYLILDVNTAVYLGGGIDFGTAIGKKVPITEILSDLKECEPGFDKAEILYSEKEENICF